MATEREDPNKKYKDNDGFVQDDRIPEMEIISIATEAGVDNVTELATPDGTHIVVASDGPGCLAAIFGIPRNVSIAVIPKK